MSELLPVGAEGREERKPFWDAIVKRSDEILLGSQRDGWNRGSSRGAGSVLLGLRGMEATLTIFVTDGTIKHFRITAFESGMSGRVELTIEVSKSDNDAHNLERLATLRKDPDGVLIVNHKFYTLGSPPAPDGVEPVRGGGFGGRLIRFQRINPGATAEDLPLFVGPVMATRNLWSGGPIAPAYHNRLPDNAIFLDGFDGPVKV